MSSLWQHQPAAESTEKTWELIWCHSESHLIEHWVPLVLREGIEAAHIDVAAKELVRHEIDQQLALEQIGLVRHQLPAPP